MLPPIQTPQFKFPVSKVPNLSLVPIDKEAFAIQEPCLTVTDVPWQASKVATTRLLSAAAPEMGDKLVHKKLGGKVTICVLCYGDYFELHQRCIDSILRTVPEERMDLRIAANCVGQASLNYLKTIPANKLYVFEENEFKYPIMRRMFYDPTAPIETEYTIWFDDNAYVQYNNWLNMLAMDIIKQEPSVAMYGLKLSYSLDSAPGNIWYWLRERPWFQGRHLRSKSGIDSATGNYVHFCADWFFAIRTSAIYGAGIPDEALLQKGGDVVIGEQLHQHGYKLKTFNLGKAYVYQPNYRDQVIRNFDYRTAPWQFPVGV